jgi:hypothetical protein
MVETIAFRTTGRGSDRIETASVGATCKVEDTGDYLILRGVDRVFDRETKFALRVEKKALADPSKKLPVLLTLEKGSEPIPGWPDGVGFRFTRKPPPPRPPVNK